MWFSGCILYQIRHGKLLSGTRFEPILYSLFNTFNLSIMNDDPCTWHPKLHIAALGGFLNGLSLLNKNSRSNFAEAFVIDAENDADALAVLRSKFSHLPNLVLSFDEQFQGGFRQLERDIELFLLVDPHVADEPLAKVLRANLSFKIMDRLDDVTELKEFEEPKRIVGTHGDGEGPMTFYLLRTSKICFVVYFYGSKNCPEN